MTIGKQQIADYRDYIETFKENLTKTVNAIFDPTTPFEARVNDPATTVTPAPLLPLHGHLFTPD